MRALYSKLRLWSNKTASQLKNVERIATSDSKSFESSAHRSWNKNIGVVPPSSCRSYSISSQLPSSCRSYSISSQLPSSRGLSSVSNHSASSAFMLAIRNLSTAGSTSPDISASVDGTQRIKFKRLDKTARHIMQIIDKEAVEEVKTNREIPEIKPGYIVQLKVEVPENKRRVSLLKGIVIARRNAGLNSTFRIRRLVAGVGIESLFPLYSPNIKEIKVLDKKKVRRAKLYYLRDKMNALRK